jgi:hypothetical protein
MKSKLILRLILFLLPAAAACKKVIQLDLNSAAPQIVIQGEVTDQPGNFQVTINQTVNFSASNNFPPVTGATVNITDSTTGQVYMLGEKGPGIYATGTTVSGTPTHTYLLSVTTAGKSYTSSSTMPVRVALDSVTLVENLDFNNKKAIDAVVNFQDPPGLGNDYRFTERVNGRLLPDIFVFEDRLSDAKYIHQTLYNDTSSLHIKDSLVMNMYGIDKNVYNYFFSLLQVTGNNGFQSASPANPISNISNGALGYFSAETMNTTGLTVY